MIYTIKEFSFLNCNNINCNIYVRPTVRPTTQLSLPISLWCSLYFSLLQNCCLGICRSEISPRMLCYLHNQSDLWLCFHHSALQLTNTCQTSKIGHFAKIVNGIHLLTIFTESCIFRCLTGLIIHICLSQHT